MKVTFNSNYGNFAYEMSVQLPEAEVAPITRKLVENGLANIAYRVAGSAVDKALGVKTGKGELGRRGVAYSAADEETINATVSKKITELEASENDEKRVPKGVSFRVTGMHEYGEKGESSMVRATSFFNNIVNSDGGRAKLVATLSLFDAAAAAPNVENAKLVEIVHRCMFATK